MFILIVCTSNVICTIQVCESHTIRELEIKLKTKKYHIVGTTPNSNRKIVERGKIKTSNTQMHNRLVICLATGTSIKSVGVKLV